MGKGLLLFALSMAIHCNQGNCKKTGDTAYKMDVYELEMVTMSQTDTPCDGFESINGVIKTTVNDTDKIQQVLRELKKAQDVGASGSINVRRKLVIFFRSGNVDTVCMDYMSQMLYNNVFKKFPHQEFTWDDFYKIIDK